MTVKKFLLHSFFKLHLLCSVENDDLNSQSGFMRIPNKIINQNIHEILTEIKCSERQIEDNL